MLTTTRIERRDIHRSVDVRASTDSVWREVTRLDISPFPHPFAGRLAIPSSNAERHSVNGAKD